MSRPPWPMIPGVPAAGHVTGGGAWHPGRADGCRKCPAPEQPFELIYEGTYPEGVRDECLHTTRHAQHPLWTRTAHQAVSAAEAAAHPGWSRCARCFP